MYPEYAEINGKQYKINTDFRVAIECNRIAEDETISDLERSLAIIEMLFGDEAIDDGKNNTELYAKFLDIGKKYLLCGEEYDIKSNEKPDMDFIEDYGLIWASFMSDYNGLDINKTNMHWWQFMDLMNGLSNSEIGNCCILNRTRNYRNIDPKEIKDKKERQKVIETQKRIALKKNQKKPTSEQRERANELLKKLGIERS